MVIICFFIFIEHRDYNHIIINITNLIKYIESYLKIKTRFAK